MDVRFDDEEFKCATYLDRMNRSFRSLFSTSKLSECQQGEWHLT